MGAILVQVRNLPSAITRYLSPVEILLEDMVKKNVGKRVTVKVLQKFMKDEVAYGVCVALVRMDKARETYGDEKGGIIERDLPRIIEWARSVVEAK